MKKASRVSKTPNIQSTITSVLYSLSATLSNQVYYGVLVFADVKSSVFYVIIFPVIDTFYKKKLKNHFSVKKELFQCQEGNHFGAYGTICHLRNKTM